MPKKEITIKVPEKVTILGVSGSPRKNANTADMIKFTLEAAKSVGYVETDYISLADHHFSYCTDCKRCAGANAPADDPPMCYEDPADETPWLHQRMHAADGLVVGVPVYAGFDAAILRVAMEKPVGGGEGGGGGPRLNTVNMGKSFWGSGYKPHAWICQGGQTYAGQESLYWDHVRRAGPLVSASWPTVEDPEPQASFQGGILTCAEGMMVYRKDAWRTEGSRINPPLTGIQNERTLRNLGRWLAVSAMMLKLGRLAAHEAEIPGPQPQHFVRYSQKPKPGSIVDRLIKEGKITYVPQEEMASRKRVKA
ncbi:MAG: flavodoxin family protein [Chloroflexi bacterium]|nr:flavodoxin family protein [Chloroflexota bacterium]